MGRKSDAKTVTLETVTLRRSRIINGVRNSSTIENPSKAIRKAIKFYDILVERFEKLETKENLLDGIVKCHIHFTSPEDMNYHEDHKGYDSRLKAVLVRGRYLGAYMIKP